MPIPEMRGSHIHSNLLELERLPEAEQIRSSIDRAVLAELEASARVAWLPVELDLAITRGVGRVLGTAGIRKWSFDALLRSTEGPLLRPVLDTARNVFGLTPHSLFGLLPRAIGLVYRNCGTFTYESMGADRGRIVHEGEPACFRMDGYDEGMAGAFEAIPWVGGRRARVRIVRDVAAQRAVYEVALGDPR